MKYYIYKCRREDGQIYYRKFLHYFKSNEDYELVGWPYP